MEGSGIGVEIAVANNPGVLKCKVFLSGENWQDPGRHASPHLFSRSPEPPVMSELKFLDNLYAVDGYDTVLKTLLKNGQAVPYACSGGLNRPGFSGDPVT